MSESLRQNLPGENRPGANGMEAVASVRAD